VNINTACHNDASHGVARLKGFVGRSTSSHDNKKFGTRSVEKQRGMVFGFRGSINSFQDRDNGDLGAVAP